MLSVTFYCYTRCHFSGSCIFYCYAEFHYAECHYAEHHYVIVMLSVVTLSVVMLIVVAPFSHPPVQHYSSPAKDQHFFDSQTLRWKHTPGQHRLTLNLE